MQYFGRTPAPPLDAFITRIWYCSDAPLHAQERVLPGGGAVDLIVNLASDAIRTHDPANPGALRARSGAIVSGAHTRSYLVDPRQRVSVMGAHFRPGGAFPFLGVSAAEIVDAHVELEDLWGGAGRELREQLLAAWSPSERLRLLEAALLAKLRRARVGHPAVAAAVAALREGGEEVRVSQVASAVGLSHRRFVEVFEREVGLTPKLYARLRRFHGVKERLARNGEPASWATLAIEAGYCDQSHMIRDFVAFSGLSPASYLLSRSEETQFDRAVHAYPGRRSA